MTKPCLFLIRFALKLNLLKSFFKWYVLCLTVNNFHITPHLQSLDP